MAFEGEQYFQYVPAKLLSCMTLLYIAPAAVLPIVAVSLKNVAMT